MSVNLHCGDTTTLFFPYVNVHKSKRKNRKYYCMKMNVFTAPTWTQSCMITDEGLCVDVHDMDLNPAAD